MGNSPPTGGLRPANGNQLSTARLGKSVRVVFTEKEVEPNDSSNNGGENETWKVVYNDEGGGSRSRCVFILSKPLRENDRRELGIEDTIFSTSSHCADMLDIKIIDTVHGSRVSTFLKVHSNETGFLGEELWYQRVDQVNLINGYYSTNCARGGITRTAFQIYGSGKRKGLVIREWKWKTKDEDYPYTGNVIHYYANAEKEVDVGLCVGLKKIRVSRDGKLDFAVDGPEQHPPHALIYMIEEVLRTGTWKPTYCPHCANKYISENKSETETSESDREGVPPPPHRRGRTPPNGPGGLVANPGRFKGKDIGNTYIRNLNYGKKK